MLSLISQISDIFIKKKKKKSFYGVCLAKTSLLLVKEFHPYNCDYCNF